MNGAAVLDGAATTAVPAPNGAEAGKVRRLCAECLAPFPVRTWQQLFCCPAHKRTYNNRWMKRGAVLAPIFAVARATRNGTRGNRDIGGRASIDANRLEQHWKEEDQAAGRMTTVDYMAARYRLGLVEILR